MPAKTGSFGDLKLRALTGVTMIVVAIAALIAGGPWFVLFWLAAAIVLNWEWQVMSKAADSRIALAVGNIALVIAATLAARLDGWNALAVVIAGMAAVTFFAPAEKKGWAAAGMAYAGIFIVCLCVIRPAMAGPIERPFDVRAIVWLFAVVWGTDIMAYFGGRLIGGPKLWPRVSAGKTWSGTIVGIVSGALFGLAVAAIQPIVPVAVLPILALGLGAAAASQAGDLLESSVKRRFGVKDSGWLIPGHGGVMDRLDGFIAAAVFVACLGAMRGLPSIAESLFVW